VLENRLEILDSCSNDLVLVTLSESSIGSRAATGVMGIYPGFDW
jgi:hypothetical protein